MSVITEIRNAAAGCSGAMRLLGVQFTEWADRIEQKIQRLETEACELSTFRSNVLRELPIEKDSPESFSGEAAGKAIRELREALTWYVDNDDTNNQPGNEHWLQGYRRGLRALGREED